MDKLPELLCPSKRIVFQHTVGPLRGLLRIVGTTDQLPNQGNPLPDFLPAVEISTPHKRVAPASLIQVRSKVVIYRELGKLPTKGRLGEFHPDQR